MTKHAHTTVIKITLSLWCLFCCMQPRAQKYNFTNYSVEQGLVQSQAQDIVQDKQGFLWIATLGGISRFDRLSFHNYSKKDGLSSLLVFRIYPASDNRIWIGSEEGIQSYNGRNFETYPLPVTEKNKAITDIKETNNGQIYFRSKAGKLFLVGKDKSVIQVKEFEKKIVTCLAADREGSLYVSVYKQGVYQLINNSWQQKIKTDQLDTGMIVRKLFFSSDHTLWILSNKGVYSGNNENIHLLVPQNKIQSVVNSIEEDNKGRIWIGTSKGAYIVNGQAGIAYFDAGSGLTDNSIFKIIKDREENLWFATDGDGIYKLTNSPLTYFNNSNGLKGNVVMGIVKDAANKMWLGTSEEGLEKYDGKRFIKYPLPSLKPETQKTNSLLFDSNKRLWIGTLGGGLWILKDGKYTEVLTEKGNHFREVVSIYEDSQATVWVCISSGVFYYNNGTMHKVAGITQPCFSVFETGKDTILAASVAGLWQVINKCAISPIIIKGKNTGTVNCFARWKNYLLLGTEDEGIIFWDDKEKKISQCSSKDGLSSDFIFSLYCDSGNTIFAGTGHGISRITVNENNHACLVKNYSPSNNIYGPECNLNAVQKAADGKLWFGTTKGVIVYDPLDTTVTKSKPLIYLTGVELFSRKINPDIAADTIIAWNPVPANLVLPHDQNHLTFEFTGLYFTNPSNIKYRYTLEGADTGYSELISTPKVIFSNLLPGKYRFKAYAITGDGVRSSNTIDFPFEIQNPFYRQSWFMLLAICTLVGLGIFIQYSRTRLTAKKEAAIQQIRLEEQQKIQERTSEDLHDDLGNKITRIAVLADVLKNKMDIHDVEKQKLISQIKENTQSLYLGTKDMIWSLTPGNDNLYDVLERCSVFGVSLFEDTDIEFITEGLVKQFKDIKISLTESRNLVMITKEAFTNILKHSGTDKAIFQIIPAGESGLWLIIGDYGKGIYEEELTNGNGLENIRKRITRIGGHMEIKKNTPNGTLLKLFFKTDQKE